MHGNHDLRIDKRSGLRGKLVVGFSTKFILWSIVTLSPNNDGMFLSMIATNPCRMGTPHLSLQPGKAILTLLKNYSQREPMLKKRIK